MAGRREDAGECEGILERLDALPTPSPLALKLLAAANDDAGDARSLTAILRQDAALTSRVLALCRRGPRGRVLEVASLDRAVVLLGFDAVRAAALAVEFIGPGHEQPESPTGFDSRRFWRHSLAKAVVAEGIARLSRQVPSSGGRAFVVGLLHDLGALAMHRAVPARFDRACDRSERLAVPLDVAARDEIGLSSSEAGAHLAVRWDLPEELREVLRWRGVGVEAVPADHPQRGLVLAAALADAIVCRKHVGGAGFGPTGQAPGPLATVLSIDASKLAALAESIFDEVAARAEALGLDSAPAGAIAADAIERANRRLERRDAGHAAMNRGERDTEPQARLEAAGDVVGTLGEIVRQASALGGGERFLVVLRPSESGRAQLKEFESNGALLASRTAGEGDADGEGSARRWCDLRSPRGGPGKLALVSRGAALATIWRADGAVVPNPALGAAPIALWTFALGAAVARDRAERSATRATEALRLLEACRERLVRDRTLACVGELAAGLAHELNNPLTVASGRAQLLRGQAGEAATRDAADAIVEACDRASELVASLLRVARPPEPRPRRTTASEIVALGLRFLRRGEDAARVDVELGASCAELLADPAQVADALAEVLQNALDVAPLGRVTLRAQCDAIGGRCIVSVRDAGRGFSERALAHGLDPFFSERSAGRGVGLGLAKARALLEASRGSVSLANDAKEGAVVTIALPLAGSSDGEGISKDRAEGTGTSGARKAA